MPADIHPIADVSSLADEMSRAFPDYRSLISEVAADVEENGGFLEYGLVSDAFRWGILDAALTSHDDSRIVACFSFIERLLRSPDNRVVDAVVIRVIPYLLHDANWKSLAIRHAGVQTSLALDRYMDGGDWRNG